MAKISGKIDYPKRGEIYFISFDPSIGAEIKKTRPALIIQNDIANRYSPLTIVAAITSKTGKELYPMEALINKNEGGLSIDSVIMLNQIRSIDKKRLGKRIGKLKTVTMRVVDQALQISLGLVEL